MRAAIQDADHATDSHTRTAALRRAIDTYTGHLAHGMDYEWVEPYREASRQQALDAFTALADVLADQPPRRGRPARRRCATTATTTRSPPGTRQRGQDSGMSTTETGALNGRLKA